MTDSADIRDGLEAKVVEATLAGTGQSVASAIVKLADALENISKGPLTTRALCLLLKDTTGVPMVAIEKILQAAPALRKSYLKATK